VAAAVVALAPGPHLRDALLARYDELAAVPRHDPTAVVRAELLRELRSLVTVADRHRLETALLTYEFGAHGENCSSLRAAALLALAEVEPEVAELHAVHLLADGYTESMSGEPALSAVRFLASRGAVGPIYVFVLSGGARQESLAEGLRALVKLPAQLVLRLAQGLRKSEDEIALVGLIDLLVAHGEPAAFADYVRDWALETDRLDLLEFAAAEIVARRREPLVEALREASMLTVDQQRKSLLQQALAR
jgi:hypothetical protein